ncbi:MAG: DegV family EDD domain-containing protein, partial [Acholeplasmatales bacterium]|nr:DegV family EDD domain-containing protein [Acholeplasmatales bacterium]
MENYNIFVDLAADIDSEIIDKYNIKFIPMNYSIDDKEYISNSYLKESEMKHFYDEMRNGKITKTSQITPFKYVEFLEEYAKNGENVFYLVLSSGLSNTYNSALLAKQELEETYPGFKMMVVDSLGATGGIGVLAQIAAINRENGMSLEDNFKF